MAFFDPYFTTRRRLKFGLTVAGLAAGAIFGAALTIFGKIVADAPPATLGNYAWNAAVFGVIAAIVSPVITWSVLRRVPLWRPTVEPLGLAIVGGAIGVLAPLPGLFLALPPIGLALGFVHLSRAFSQEPDENPVLARSVTVQPADKNFQRSRDSE